MGSGVIEDGRGECDERTLRGVNDTRSRRVREGLSTSPPGASVPGYSPGRSQDTNSGKANTP